MKLKATAVSFSKTNNAKINIVLLIKTKFLILKKLNICNFVDLIFWLK